MKPANASIERATILRAAHSALSQVGNNVGRGLLDSAAKYHAKAEALIELLEVDDCGSRGGYDVARGQKTGLKTPLERYEWLASVPIGDSYEVRLRSLEGEIRKLAKRAGD